MRTDRRSLISVVLSFRDEAGNIPALVSRLAAALADADVDYELLFVNDASTDQSLDILRREHETNPRVKIVNMSRRFGVAECVRAGMRVALGDAVVYMDADLQDPPEVIPALIDQWRRGADVVHTVRTRRHGESRVKTWLTGRAYRLVQLGSTIRLPVDAGDFKLLSRAAVTHLLSLEESDPYLRGLVVWLGFTQVFVPYERDARHAGRTHFPLFFSRNPWKTLLLGLTSFSFAPIYACALLGLAGLVGSAALGLVAAIQVARHESAGLTALLALVTFFWASTLTAICVVGLYVVRTYKDVRGRPQYIVASTIGVQASEKSDLRVGGV